MTIQQRAHQAARAITAWLGGIAQDTRGNVAMLFGMSLPVLLMIVAGGVDISRISTAKVGLQDALDAATLAAARSPYTEAADIQRVGMDALKANLAAQPTMSLLENETTFVLVNGSVVVADARVNVRTVIANIVLPPYGQIMDDELPVGVHSEVTRSSKNIEVALVLDVTGSMAGSRMTALKAAAKNLINIVVQEPEKQTPYYSKAAIIPYSIGVNAGDWADDVRGELQGPTSITNAVWFDTPDTAISRVTRVSTAVVTSNGHGLETGDHVWISGVSAMSSINNRAYVVTKINNNEVRLNGLNTTGFSNNGTNGRIRRCLYENCVIAVTSSNHTMQDNDWVSISGVQGLTVLNGIRQVQRVNNNTFTTNATGARTAAYTSGGQAQCGYDGCEKRIFRRANGTVSALTEPSDCVSDRAGSSAYTDATPQNGAWLGRLYPTADGCSPRVLTPLWDQRAELVDEIDRLQPQGSTAGQIGLSWGWYALSNRFSGIWGSGRGGAAPDPSKTLKAIILMTDGEFNTTYCQGVLASNANYSDNSRQIDCNATNGNPFQQTADMCDAIKAVRRTGGTAQEPPAILIYTVGLSVSTNRGGAGIDTAREVLEYCATSPDRAKFATNATQLNNAFEEFGRDIVRLRIAK